MIVELKGDTVQTHNKQTHTVQKGSVDTPEQNQNCNIKTLMLQTHMRQKIIWKNNRKRSRQHNKMRKDKEDL